MSNRPALIIFGLSILAGSAMAEPQRGNLFLPSVTPAKMITAGFTGKPPYRNRHQFITKIKEQKAARAATENLDKTELSALEISEKDDKSPITGKSTRKRYGHPYHR